MLLKLNIAAPKRIYFQITIPVFIPYIGRGQSPPGGDYFRQKEQQRQTYP